MTRNLRILGVALAATLAIGACAAAVAAADEFRSEGNQAVVMTGKGTNNVFKTTIGSFECTTATYSGTVAATPTASVTLTPSYSGCTCFGGFACTADINGCQYKMNIAGATTGTMEIVCPAGQEITLTALGGLKCTVHIKPQTLSTVTYKNVGAGTTREIELLLELKNIHYTHTEGTGVGKCVGSGTGKEGTYEGTVLVTGESDTATPAHVGIFVQ